MQGLKVHINRLNFQFSQCLGSRRKFNKKDYRTSKVDLFTSQISKFSLKLISERYIVNNLWKIFNLFYSRLNPIRDRGGVQHPLYRKSALRPSKWPPNEPKFCDFSFFYMTYLKTKIFFLGFSQWFWVFRRGWWLIPTPLLNVYFQPNPK